MARQEWREMNGERERKKKKLRHWQTENELKLLEGKVIKQYCSRGCDNAAL